MGLLKLKDISIFSTLAIMLACSSASAGYKVPQAPPSDLPPPACSSVDIQTTQSSAIYLKAIYPYEYNGQRVTLNLCQVTNGKESCSPLLNEDAAFPRYLLKKAAEDTTEHVFQKLKDGFAKGFDKLEVVVGVVSPGQFAVGAGIVAAATSALSGQMDNYLKNQANIRFAQNILDMALNCQPGPFPNADPSTMAAILRVYLATVFHDDWNQIMTPQALAQLKQSTVAPWSPPSAPAQNTQVNNVPVTAQKTSGSATDSSTSQPAPAPQNGTAPPSASSANLPPFIAAPSP
jgi:hypothetical protein